MQKNIIILTLTLFLMISWVTSAHQPRIPEGTQISVSDPEISKAYYTELQGTPHIYTIISDVSFALYINILVPDILWQKKDITAKIIQNWDIEKPFSVLNGNTFEWVKLFEPFGYDTYWKWPEYKAMVGAGKYDIIVSSTDNDTKYSLAIGEAENFDFQEIMNALTLVPKIKRDFFDESSISFIFSPFGWGLIVIMYILAFIFGFVYRYVVRIFTKDSTVKVSKNIGQWDRLVRAMIGLFLLILAITTSWSPILIFFSGFAFFEAIFSWCWLYAALGKNTCPLIRDKNQRILSHYSYKIKYIHYGRTIFIKKEAPKLLEPQFFIILYYPQETMSAIFVFLSEKTIFFDR